MGVTKHTEHSKKLISQKLKGKNQGRSWYKNPNTYEMIFLKNGDKIPKGFIKGRLNLEELVDKRLKEIETIDIL